MSTTNSSSAGVPGAAVEGVLEIDPRGAAFVRDPKRHLVPRPDDPQVARGAITKFNLRGGELLSGPVGVISGPRGQRLRQLGSIVSINGVPAAKWSAPPPLQDTTAIDPTQLIHFDTPGGPASMRIVQLFTPIGRGQRGLIVSPPKAGKTMLLQQMAHGIAVNHPDIYMVVLLVDERPEEVTEMRRSVRGEVIASSNDLDVESHVRVARLVIERARRMVELGQHVVVLLDSITRLGRAFNSFVGSSGRTMTGGLDIKALQEPKQIFGSARAVEHGGSLTIVATALVDTGSRADNFIFEEFKGTGNMELVLNRELANLRIWPALNLQASGTRKEEKLLDPDTLKKSHMLRRQLNDLPPAKQITTLVERMSKHEDLAAFLKSLQT
ncbi:MAG: transcription termination factor Rho [Phycisphaerae bacterium]|jgi:transcription termination factor Rho